jgi:hypothetical protein
MQTLFIYIYHRTFDFSTSYNLDDRFSLFATFFFKYKQLAEKVHRILVQELNVLYEHNEKDTEEEKNEKDFRILLDYPAVQLMKFTAPYEQPTV